MKVMHTVELLVMLVAALATGGLMVNWTGLARAMARLSASTYVELHQNTNRTFDPYMPVVVGGAILSGFVLAVAFGIRTASGQLGAAGAACYAVVIRFHVIRTLFSVPAFVLYTAALILRTT